MEWKVQIFVFQSIPSTLRISCDTKVSGITDVLRVWGQLTYDTIGVMYWAHLTVLRIFIPLDRWEDKKRFSLNDSKNSPIVTSLECNFDALLTFKCIWTLPHLKASSCHLFSLCSFLHQHGYHHLNDLSMFLWYLCFCLIMFNIFH
jgi:hypothetical protein